MRAGKSGIRLIWLMAAAGAVVFSAAVSGGEPSLAPAPDQKLVLMARSRIESPRGSGKYPATTRRVEWKANETAIIICDMWDRHWCPSATARVAELAPAINEFVTIARGRGVLIVHAPSETMEFYKDYPQRRAAQNAPTAPNLPEGMARGRQFLNRRELLDRPVDDFDGGCDCPHCRSFRAWSRENPALEIKPEDVISDSGTEIWNLFEQSGIKNVILVGVHVNMCVVARPFGLRNWVRFGKNAILIRDLTDSMYNPARRPYVDHFTGTDRVIEHIEKYICPAVLSTDITGRPAFRFRDDKRSFSGQ